ncbi:TlpA disulfide reductase family protein [Streptomyces sp. Li-HN-5-11]|jgi:thiol-disulfide isomerase/thioredoxin|uniref:TlpA family protein disulfide reductase n=1 Tax=Streptomyces sp. Li-HN-5-11 TaxID=3075432 RepID=UPI0028ACBD4B|nr:TlpA disulfide reductase family protein [Streptomyces sp. Li-HN-5-11]WNM29428.1 TlpA disulfide reductase family protein [Streptomyces sp. Li-HN-5-11]HJT77487.1 TlpA disulfide reductase family protein [Gemmataceae bacterium]
MSAASRAPQCSNRANRTPRPHRTRTSRVLSRASLLTAGTAVAALTLSACGSGGTSGGSGNTNFITGADGIATVHKGDRKPAPDLSGRTIDGKQLDVASYKGKVVVLNVWGSWCSPCRAEAPNLVKVAKETAGKGVQFIGINTRDTSTQPAIAFEKQYGVPYPSLYDPTGKLMLRFKKGTLNPQLIPTTIIVDRDGKIAARALQALSEDKLREMLDPVIAEK